MVTHFPQLESSTFIIYHGYIVLLFALSILFTYKVLRLLKINTLWAFIAALSMSLISPQYFRLIMGHMNLATPLFIILPIYQYLSTFGQYKSKDVSLNRGLKRFLAFFVAYLIATFSHLYLPVVVIAVLGTLGAADFIFSTLKDRALKATFFKAPIFELLPALLAMLTGMLAYASIDSNASSRSVGAAGFDWVEWNLAPEAIFTAYKHFLFRPIDYFTYPVENENVGYLGGFALVALLLISIYWLVQKYLKKKLVREENKRLFLYCLLFSGAVFFSMAIGVDVHVFNRSVHFVNYLNPFFYLTKVSDAFTQFRTLARFGWPVFWVLNIVALVCLQQVVQQTKQKLVKVFLFCLPLLFIVDLYSNFQNRRVGMENPFSEAHLTDLGQEFDGVNTTDYQAILALPFYAVGAKEMEYTIDPYDAWCTRTFMFNMLTDLPLVNYKASRSIKKHAESILSIISDKVDPELQKALRKHKKPLLLIQSKEEAHWDVSLPDVQALKALFKESKTLASRLDLKKIKETERHVFYVYKPF